jgi:protein-L-isoaspartate(D-aspartate) O-methyltransferase
MTVQDDRRRDMVTDQLASRNIGDPRVLDAFLRVPRHLFVREDDVDRAYADRPLEIGDGQTISQPYIVALTLQLARIAPAHRVLEIGTGSGYQTALLALLAGEVFTIERIEPLAALARRRLDALGAAGVRFRVGDGTLGWPEAGPFDAIVVSAGGPKVPEALTAQLAPGGRLVIPVGPHGRQELVVVERTQKGLVTTSEGECTFVKLIGEGGWSEKESTRSAEFG